MTQAMYFVLKNINQLTHGQPVWKHTDLIIFPNYHYSDQSNIMQMLESGFHIDSIENHFTEDKRVTYNSKNPKIPFIKKFIENHYPNITYTDQKISGNARWKSLGTMDGA